MKELSMILLIIGSLILFFDGNFKEESTYDYSKTRFIRIIALSFLALGIVLNFL